MNLRKLKISIIKKLIIMNLICIMLLTQLQNMKHTLKVVEKMKQNQQELDLKV